MTKLALLFLLVAGVSSTPYDNWGAASLRGGLAGLTCTKCTIKVKKNKKCKKNWYCNLFAAPDIVFQIATGAKKCAGSTTCTAWSQPSISIETDAMATPAPTPTSATSAPTPAPGSCKARGLYMGQPMPSTSERVNFDLHSPVDEACAWCSDNQGGMRCASRNAVVPCLYHIQNKEGVKKASAGVVSVFLECVPELPS